MSNFKQTVIVLTLSLLPMLSLAEEAILSMTADELVTAEHGNKARFMRDIVGKTVKVTGRVKVIQEKYFTLEASGSLSGWDVFTSDKNILADLNVGQMVTMTCPVTDTVFIGGNSKCD